MSAQILNGANDKANATATSGTSIVVGRPPATVVGDALLFIVANQTLNGSSSGLPASAVKLTGTPVTGHRTLEAWAVPVPDAAALAALPASFTITGNPATSARWIVAVRRVIGANLAALSAGTTNDVITSSPFTTIALPALGGLDAGALSIAIAHANSTSAQGNPVWASKSAEGWTRIDAIDTVATGTASNDSLVIDARNGPAPAITEDAAVAAQSGLMGFTFAIAPAVAAPPAFTSTPGASAYKGGSEIGAKFVVWDGAAEKPVTAVTTKQAPFTIAGLQAAPPFDIGHRGASKNYPEMTKFAYIRAANRGMKALEISVQRSSDGVFVCHHDTDTSRMTGVADVIKNTTWADLSLLTNTAAATTDTSQPRRPMARIEEIVDLYAWDHVLFIEDKSGANADALLAYIQTIPNFTQRVVWKCYGPLTAVAAKGKALGMTTWGFYFDVDMPNFASTNASYDMLGLDVNSSDATISSAITTAGSRPVIGHVISTTAQRTRMLGLGCKGLMTSDISTVPGIAA